MEISNASGIARIARKLRANCAYPRPPTPTPVPHPSPASRPCSTAPVNAPPAPEGQRATTGSPEG